MKLRSCLLILIIGGIVIFGGYFSFAWIFAYLDNQSQNTDQEMEQLAEQAIAKYNSQNSEPTDAPPVPSVTADEPPAAELPAEEPGDESGDEPPTYEPPAEEPPATETPPATDNGDAEFLDFFTLIANHDMTGTHELGITRWKTNPVYIKIIEGTPTPTQQTCLEEYIRDFNSTSATTKLQQSTTVDHDMRLFFLPGSEVQELYGDSEVDGFHEPNTDDTGCEYVESKIFISNDITNDVEYQCHLVRHELTHAIGFHGHAPHYSDSIMDVPHTDYSFNTIDRRAIQTLYNSGLPECSMEKQTREYFATHALPQ